MTDDEIERLYGRVPKRVIKELWEAAMTHCMIHYGEHMKGDPEFEMPEDQVEAIGIVTTYLKNAQ